MEKKILFRAVIEVLGKPQEHVDKSLKQFVEKLKTSGTYEVISEEYADLKKQEEQELLIKAQSEGVELSVWRQSKKYDHDNPNHLCPWVFTRPYISCDLRTVPCSMIGNPDVSEFGDATHLKDTWNSENYINFRRSHLQGNVPDMCKLCYV